MRDEDGSTEAGSGVQPGSLYVVATPIGNLADISPRALGVLRSVQLILAEDTRHSGRLLQHYGIDVPKLSFHKFNEKSRTEQVIERMRTEGMSVAIVTDAGTPCISDPGVEIVRQAREMGIPVFGVSGPSAIATAVSVSGLPSREFTFLGFLPRTAGELRAALRGIRERRTSTFVVYESPKRIRDLAMALAEEFPQAKACFCCELTKVHERSYYGTIPLVAALLEQDPNAERGEYTVVVHVDQAEDDAAGTAARAKKIPIEARLVQVMVERGCTLKEAASAVTSEANLPRNYVYQASLRLKSLFRPE